MAIYRGPGGAGDATADATNAASVAEGFADDASVSAAAAANSAAAASAAETAAEAAQTAAEAAQTAAETAETNAETAETNAETAQAAAEAARDAALSHAGNAEAFADAAEISAGNAETSYQNTLLIFGNADDVAAAVLAAETSAGNAEAFATAAEISAGNAETFSLAASGYADTALSHAGNAESFATAASGYATTALSHAGNAETSATNAETSYQNTLAIFGNAETLDAAITAVETTYDAFDDRYLGDKASAPSVDNDGNALLTGALYFDTTQNQMKVYDGSSWGSVGSTVNGTAARFKYVATSSQTTFSGTDANGNTLAYDPGFLDVFLNGVRLDETDFTATTGTSIVLDVGAATDDELNIVAYGNFELADVYTKAQSDAKYQLLDADTAKLDVEQTWSANQNFADYLVQRPTLQDYAVEGSAIGNVGATRTFDLAVANFFSATVDQASTFTFSNPPASGDFGAFVIELTNGGAYLVTWPAAVDWPGGTSPTLTESGVDQLVFTTRDGGTTWFGFVAGLDIKTPA